MKLDPRIIEGKKPLTALDTDVAKEFIGKQCYFADNIEGFFNLDNTNVLKGRLTDIDDDEMIGGCFKSNGIRSSIFSHFIVPCEWVKEVKEESQYRAFTFDEFLDKFQVGQVIRYRSKSQPYIDILESLSVMRINRLHKDISVRLSVGIYDPQGLFEEFEIFEPEDPLNPTAKDWKPFGVKV